MDDLSDDLKSVFITARDAGYEKQVSAVRKECSDAVDKDEILSKIVNSIADRVGKKEAEDAKKELGDRVFDDVQRKILVKEEYGPDMVKDSIQRARSLVSKLGIHTLTSEKPVVLGLGPSGYLPAEVHSNETIKRVSSNDAGYDENAVARFAQMAVRAARADRSR
ncbi:MAG: hypothetical protein ACYTEO_13440 [Planctomycetota bacterium]|jgi:hypothetical protein